MTAAGVDVSRLQVHSTPTGIFLLFTPSPGLSDVQPEPQQFHVAAPNLLRDILAKSTSLLRVWLCLNAARPVLCNSSTRLRDRWSSF